MNDINRNIAKKITILLEQFPAVALIGPRQCGKTTLAKQLKPTWTYLDLENPNDYDRLTYDPLFFFSEHEHHLIIDEAQEYPKLFSVLRGLIDNQRHKKGRFILTGSSNPALLNHISESLAGRIALLELGTLKVNEYYNQPLPDFYQLFEQKLDKQAMPIPQTSSLTIPQIQTLWLKGGYPEPVLQKDNLFYDTWMDNYRKTYIERDIAKLFPRLNKIAYRRFLNILGQLSGTIINKRDLGRTLEVNEGTVREYLTIAEGTFLWRQLPSFERNVVKSIIKMPKGHIRDLGLLHYLLGIHSRDDLAMHPILGHSFESFVIEEIIKGLQSTTVTNWYPYYYRTRNGAEIDLILHGPFGTLPIEIKHGCTVNRKNLIHLSQFIEEHQLPYGMVINQSETVEWLTPKIVQIPVGLI